MMTINMQKSITFKSLFLSVLLTLSLVAGYNVVKPQKATAKRATAYDCRRYVTFDPNRNVLTRPEGTYYTVHYGIAGNDSARSQFGEFGANIDGPDGDCAWWIGYNSCYGLVEMWWRCDGTVDYNNDFYRSLFGGRSATNVYLGTPINNPANFAGFEGVAALLNDDATNYTNRSGAGISATPNHPFATNNDAGKAFINGNPVVCMGLGFRDDLCRYNVFDAYNNGSGVIGAWAGYMNGTNGNSVNNVNPFFRNTLFRGSGTPGGTIASGGSFNLYFEAVNSQDPWWGCSPVWNNGAPPASPSPSRCYTPEPFTNDKFGVFITYFVPAEQRGGLVITKYGPGVGIDRNGHPTGFWADPNSAPGNNNVCVRQRIRPNPRFGIGCGTTNPFNTFGALDALKAGTYELDLTPAPGWRIKTIRAGRYPYPYINLGTSNYPRVNIGDNTTLYVDVYYEPKPITCDKTGDLVLSTDPSFPEANQDFSVGLPFTSANNKSYAVRVDSVVPFGLVGLTGTVRGRTPPSVATFNGIRATRAGVYTVTYRVTVDGETETGCKGQIRIVRKPYLRVYGNDVMAGGNFTDPTTGGCVAYNDQAGIHTFDKRTSAGSYSGGGSQLAAFALGHINNFFSAAMRNAATQPIPPTGLTFGNHNGTAFVSDYGGLSGVSRCIPDYYGTHTGTPGPRDSISRRTGNSVINQPPIADGVKRVIYVEGDAYIDNNIQFANTNWSSIDNIPSFYLIVKGNIYIDADVEQLDGVYIAQPVSNAEDDSAKGIIYTCARREALRFEKTPPSQLYTTCTQKLNISGAFIARHVKFLRSSGTVNQSSSNEASASNNIAEVFNFSPEMYLADQPKILNSLDDSPVNYDYDSIISLPPIL